MQKVRLKTMPRLKSGRQRTNKIIFLYVLFERTKGLILAVFKKVDNMITLQKKPLVSNFAVNTLYVNKSDLCGVMVTPDFMAIKPCDIIAINITGREWYDKINGNSYNDFTIEFALKNGTQVQAIYGVMCYGYGDYYMQRARCTLKLLGLFCHEIPFFNHKITGCKKRELLTVKDVEKWGCKSLLKLAEGAV